MAALTLQGLQEMDRAWLLDRLAPQERHAIAPLLEELRALDLAVDAETLKNLLLPPAPIAPKRPLERASAGAARAALQGEPPALVAAVLSAKAWPWRDAVRESLGVLPGAGHALPARALDALLDELERRLPHDEVAAPAAPPPRARPAWKRVFAWRG
jgi:hypothetical protein